MAAKNKDELYEEFKNWFGCNSFCDKQSRQICCPELMTKLCIPKQKLLNYFLSLQKENKDLKGKE